MQHQDQHHQNKHHSHHELVSEDKGKPNLLFIGILLIGVVGIMLFLGKGLTKVSVVDFTVNEISDFTDEYFTVSGTVTLKNPSRISVPIQDITYKVILVDTQETIGTGSIPGFVLEKNGETTVAFQQKVLWKVGFFKALKLSRTEDVLIKVDGIINVDVPGETPYQLTFEKTINIVDQIKVVLKDKLSFWN